MVHLNHRSPVLIAWSSIFFFIAAVAVVLRVASTHIRRRDFKIHDYLIFFSLVGLTVPWAIQLVNDDARCY